MISAAQVKVKATPTKLEVPEGISQKTQSGSRYYVRNDGAVDVFIGPESVTAANGFRIPKETTMPFPFEPSVRHELLYGIVASGEGLLHLLRF